MSDDLRELIARVCNQPTPLQTADAILAALDAAGWTIVKRNTALTAAGDNPHDAPLARAALRVQAVALAAFQQTPATPNPGSIPAGEADTPTEGKTGSQQQEDRCRTLKTNRSTDAHVERWYARWPNTPEKGNRQ